VDRTFEVGEVEELAGEAIVVNLYRDCEKESSNLQKTCATDGHIYWTNIATALN
jgi:hypothetical protein